MDAELLEHSVVGNAFLEGRDDHVVGDVGNLVADLAEPLDVLRRVSPDLCFTKRRSC